jgi:hypothetical protein
MRFTDRDQLGMGGERGRRNFRVHQNLPVSRFFRTSRIISRTSSFVIPHLALLVAELQCAHSAARSHA